MATIVTAAITLAATIIFIAAATYPLMRGED